MFKYIKHHWLEIIVFSVIFGVLLSCLAPSATWVNTDSDGIHDTYAASNLYLSHKTSMPFYLLVGHLFTRIPFGTDFWNLALFSALATVGACIFIYLSIKERLKDNPQARWYSLLGVVVYGGSALVISQSTIVETYALVTMLGAGAYYFYLRQWWKRCALMLGLGLAIHLLAGVPLLMMFIFSRELRRWKPILIVLACLLFYLYIPLSATLFPDQPNMWGNKTITDMLKDLMGTYNSLFGSIAIYDLPKRLLDAGGLVIASLGLAVVPAVWYVVKNKKLRHIEFWLFILPIALYITGLPPQTYVYVMPSIAIGAVIASVMLAKMHVRWFLGTAMVAITLLFFNFLYLDIGRTLDPELSATKYFEEELDKVPDGEILMPYYGWEWAAIFAYNDSNDRGIVPVCLDTIRSPTYQEQLKEMGIKFRDNDATDIWLRQNHIALSIIELNDNVWTTKTTTPETYGAVVVKAQGNEHLVARIPDEPAGMIHWKPSNPYDIITGAIEVGEWKFITLSNWSVRLYVGLAAIGLLLNWLIFILPSRKQVEEDEDTL